ncbi:hypothetical protein Bhyg_11512 [Pseudolycoriella hygida]|uniref:Ig-like domain-containing protein n=1 Tax=Pseudolycoriella hygida TaxID=35572 RepID=A0A9Q0MWG3_9DIPT|nr:hypothetical protein Bhyg_11512 [Pseudolycoriella hygida]
MRSKGRNEELWQVNMVMGLRVNVTVPKAVTSGSNATIVCDHDLDSDNVYTVKWYKSGHEFFRYTPREFPALKLFWLPGIKVDLEESNATHVQLKKVSPKQTGRYSCEVSADAPSFDTKLVSSDLEVVVLPLHEPYITGTKEQYQSGELLQANCTSNGSLPSATLEWKINNVPGLF